MLHPESDFCAWSTSPCSSEIHTEALNDVTQANIVSESSERTNMYGKNDKSSVANAVKLESG